MTTRSIVRLTITTVLFLYAAVALAVACPGLVPILALFGLWWARPTPSWDEEIALLLNA